MFCAIYTRRKWKEIEPFAFETVRFTVRWDAVLPLRTRCVCVRVGDCFYNIIPPHQAPTEVAFDVQSCGWKARADTGTDCTKRWKQNF